MQLSNAAGETFELAIVAYQFPHNVTESYDANWLQVRFSATHRGRTWSATDPCLLTWEVARLARWFKALGLGQATEPECRFLEPVLAFSLQASATGQVVRVSFALEGRPPWADKDAGIWLDFPVQEIDFARVVQSLEAQLQHYPQRVVEKSG